MRRLVVPIGGNAKNVDEKGCHYPRTYRVADSFAREDFERAPSRNIPLSDVAAPFLITPPALPDDNQYTTVKFYTCSPAMCNAFFFNAGEVRRDRLAARADAAAQAITHRSHRPRPHSFSLPIAASTSRQSATRTRSTPRTTWRTRRSTRSTRPRRS